MGGNCLKRKTDYIQEELRDHISTIRVDSEVAYFVNLGDIHWGLCNRELFEETFAYLMSIPDLYVGIGGDAGNGTTKLSKGNVTEEWSFGENQIYELAEILKPYADRILYIIEGNHGAGRMKNEVFFTPEKMLATLIGRPEIYKGEFCFLYFNVGKNCFTHFVQHLSPKRDNVWDWVSADVTWREHHHQRYHKEKVVIEHNKFEKLPVPKVVYEVWGGTFQVYPKYAKYHGYRVGVPGCYICEMRKNPKQKDLFLWTDEEFQHIMK